MAESVCAAPFLEAAAAAVDVAALPAEEVPLEDGPVEMDNKNERDESAMHIEFEAANDEEAADGACDAGAAVTEALLACEEAHVIAVAGAADDNEDDDDE